jgi:hypothetical protein
MTYTYWKRHPRNFGNEYEIGIASTKDDADQYEAESFSRIDRDYALRLLSCHAQNGQQLYRSVTVNGYEYDTPANEFARRIRKGQDLT